MSEFPRQVEGRGVHEIFPGVFWAPLPDEEASYGDGSRVGYGDFVDVAHALHFGAPVASRAFNSVYLSLRSQAIEAGHYRYSGYGRRPAWEYYYNANNISKPNRARTLLATQSVYDYFVAAEAQRPPSQPILKELKVIQSLLELDEPDIFEPLLFNQEGTE